MSETPGAKTRTVGDIMSSPAITATAQESIAQVAKQMEELSMGSVVVVDDHSVMGILTERDIVHFASSGADPNQAKVKDWMTSNPETVAPSVEVSEGWRSLAAKGYHHVPVVDETGLVGIISMTDLMKVSQIRPIETNLTDVPKGLENVAVAETSIGDVRGLEGFYHYRQYSAIELAQKKSLEDVWHLFFEGHLPNKQESENFSQEIRSLRYIPEGIKDLLPEIVKAGDQFVALDALRTAVSLFTYALDFKPSLDIDAAQLRQNAMQVSSVIATLVMALYRISKGQQPIDPNPDLGHAANYVYMLTGQVPSPEVARAVEQYLISVIDHGFNASTFTARVITSTGADLGAAVVGAIGALSGPLHGGAPSRALDMLDAIQKPENAEAWIRNKVQGGERIMGFGHRVYKTDDPRSLMLREVAIDLGGDIVDFAQQVESQVVAILAELKPGRRLYTNVEFYAGVVLNRCGIPRELFTPTFVASRIIGWSTHVLEQAADNRLIRPSARYIGPPPPQPVEEFG